MSGRKFKCTLFALLQAGDSTTNAALDPLIAPRINLRLAPPWVTNVVTLIADIRQKVGARAGQKGGGGTLTLAQQKLMHQVTVQVSKARKTARRAFKGNSVKLHSEFLVNKPSHNAGDTLGNARIVSASLKTTDNAAALQTKGWLDADTATLDQAIGNAANSLTSADNLQHDEVGATAFVNTEANQVYDAILDLQNAADLEFPEDDPTNIATRARFLLGVFPPDHGTSPDTPTPTAPPPPAQP
jgi:hypothetical protein